MSLRDSLLASTQPKIEEVTLPDGKVVNLRQVTIGQRQKITEKATTKGVFDNTKFSLLALIESAVDPETGQKFLDETDLPAMLEMPVSGTIETLCAKALELMSTQAAVKN